MVLSTKPHNSPWLYLSPRLCTLGQDDFDYAPALAGDKHDVLGPVSGGLAGNESPIREVRCDPRGNGRGVITRVPQQLLSQSFKTLNSHFCQMYQKVINWPCAGTICNLQT